MTEKVQLLLSSRVKDASESITLKLNEKANALIENGHHVFNLTAGQLPFRPMPEFVEKIKIELNFLKSFQYAPVPGVFELRQKVTSYIEQSRKISFSENNVEIDSIVSNGAKHSIYNLLGALVDPGDEVVILSPYWVSYPEMIKFWGGVPIKVKCHSFDGFIPSVSDIERALTPRTKAIILNSPNNPAGIHYSDGWMQEFAKVMRNHPHLFIISDEIYHMISYFDPKPTFFYQKFPDLLSRTIIVDGISKSFAATGLRIGFAVGARPIINAMSKIQGQTTSGASSLIQRAVLLFDFSKLDEFLDPIKSHLRSNANTIRETLREFNLGKCWYQSMSAFYFMLDFSHTPKYMSLTNEDNPDLASMLCEEILQKQGVAIIPGSDFGMPNTARISLVAEQTPFKEAMTRICQYLTSP